MKYRLSHLLTGLCFSLVLAGSGQSLPSLEKITPEHIAKLQQVTSVAMSPDGRNVAYTVAVQRKPFKDEDGPNWVELHMAVGGSDTRAFVSGEVNVGAVKWKPDGRSVSFLAKRGKDKTRSLYVISLDGGEARNVLSFDTDIQEYSFSPDGSRVAFIADEKETKEVKNRKEKGFDQEIYEEDFAQRKVWIATLNDAKSKPRALKLPGVPSEIHWSPIGVNLAVAIAATPLVDDQYMRRKLMVYNIDSGALVSSFQNVGKLGMVAWNSDGTLLALISAQDINDPSEGRLFIANLKEASLQDILPQYEGHVTSIQWQDKDTLKYVGGEGVWTTFNQVSRDGTNKTTIIPSGKVTISAFSLSKNPSSTAFLIDSPKHPAELFTTRQGDVLPKRITNSNPWLENIAMAEQELLTYKARDGLMIEGILIRPLKEVKGRRYPLILSVHGGPEAHHTNGWLTGYSAPGQVAAAKGFAVFYPNYRGSTGRGVEFSKLSQADPAGKEFDDLVDGVDYLIDIGLVDKNKVGVTGASYGGYATAWCSTFYSERFAAGVMFVGISNKISKSGTTDIPDEEYLVHARKRPWDDWQHFLERSPIYHVKKAKTPMLIMHGKDDPRVAPLQSMELYRHLKTLGQAPVRLVWYPKEAHGNRKASAKYDYNLRMMQWFEHYLQGKGGKPPPFEISYPIKPADEKES